MGFWMLLFWAGVILLVIWGVRAASSGGGGDRRSEPDRALRILEERFARGEIDRAEFEERKAALESR
jgi:putative membrane protein